MRKVLAWVGGVVAVLLLSWGALHFVISPVNPEQEPPEKHVSAPCWTCHIVSASADIKQPEGAGAP